MSTTISMKKAKTVLTILWFVFSGILFLLFLVQTIFNRYGDLAEEAWGWLLPAIMPTLSLIVAAFVAEAAGRVAPKPGVSRLIFTVSVMLSSFYFIAICLVVFLGPFSDMGPLTLMKTSNLALGPLQGLVSASIAIFFISDR